MDSQTTEQPDEEAVVGKGGRGDKTRRGPAKPANAFICEMEKIIIQIRECKRNEEREAEREGKYGNMVGKEVAGRLLRS